MCTVPDQSGGPQRSIEASEAMLIESASGGNEREDPGDEHRVVPDGRGQAGDPLLLGGDALLPQCAEAEAGLLAEAKRGLGSVGLLSGAALSAAGGVRRWPAPPRAGRPRRSPPERRRARCGARRSVLRAGQDDHLGAVDLAMGLVLGVEQAEGAVGSSSAATTSA